MTVIGACGYSGTGSSAVSDLLREYPETQVIDQCEFILPYEPDGLADLEYHLFDGLSKFSSSNTAIYRFRKAIRGGQFRYIRELTHGKIIEFADDYLDELTQCCWVGSDPADLCNQRIRDLAVRAVRKFHMGKIYYGLEKYAGHELNLFPMNTMWFSSHPDNFYSATKRFVSRVLNEIQPVDPSKKLVLDQPFPGNNPQKCFPYFDDPMAIVVDRDPRDLYLLTKEFWFESDAWRPLPTNTAEQFVAYYKGLRFKDMLDDSERVLRIQFEDLVYRYDDTRQKIEAFCGLSSNANPRSSFDPSKSVNNTQLFHYYPGYKKELDYISSELGEYLYPFEQFGSIDFDRDAMFD